MMTITYGAVSCSIIGLFVAYAFEKSGAFCCLLPFLHWHQYCNENSSGLTH